MKGKIIVFSAPSGCGKGTVIGRLMKEHPELRLVFSVSATSRAPREGEQHGKHYYFLTPDDFRRRIEAGEFVEHVEVYKDLFYGSLRSEVDARLERGENVVLDIDVEGGCQVKQIYGEEVLSVFLLPPKPCIETLRARLIARGTETPEAIEKRLERAEYEMSFAPRYDHVVVNDVLDEAVEQAYRLIADFVKG